MDADRGTVRFTCILHVLFIYIDRIKGISSQSTNVLLELRIFRRSIGGIDVRIANSFAFDNLTCDIVKKYIRNYHLYLLFIFYFDSSIYLFICCVTIFIYIYAPYKNNFLMLFMKPLANMTNCLEVLFFYFTKGEISLHM